MIYKKDLAKYSPKNTLFKETPRPKNFIFHRCPFPMTAGCAGVGTMLDNISENVIFG